MPSGTLKDLLVRLGVDSKALVAGLREAETRTNKTVKSFDGMVKASKRADAAMALQAQKTQALADKQKVLTDAAKKAGVALSAVAVAGGAFLFSATKLAARVETLDVVVQQLGTNAGYSSTQLREFERGIKSQGITLQKTRQSMAMMMQAQIDLTAGTKLAALAQNTAVIANVDSSEAFQRLTYVVQTGNVLMGRRMGLNLDFMKSQKDLADTLGKTREELTSQEIIQSRLNEVLRVGKTVTGAYDAAMETTSKKMLSLNRHVEESRRIIGEVFVGALGKAVDWITNLLKSFQNLSVGQQATIAVVIASITAFSGLAGAGLLVVAMLPSLIAGFTALSGATSLALGPIGLVVIGIIALTTALVAAKVAMEASHKAFAKEEKILRTTSESYQDYLEGVRELAEQEEMIVTTKEDLVAGWEEHNRIVAQSHGLHGHMIDVDREWALVMSGLTNYVIAATDAEFRHAMAIEATALRLKNLIPLREQSFRAMNRNRNAVEEFTAQFDRGKERVKGFFDAINTGVKTVIEQRIKDIEFLAAGGGLIQAAERAITSALEAGMMTPEQAEEWYRPLLAKAFLLEVELGNLTYDEMVENLGGALKIPVNETIALLDSVNDMVFTTQVIINTAVRTTLDSNTLRAMAWWDRELSATQESVQSVITEGRKYPGKAPPRLPPGLQMGGSGIVPPGYPNDSYPLMVTSGERFTVTPAGKSESGLDIKELGRMIAGMIPNINVEAQIYGDQDVYELAYIISDIQEKSRR